MGLCIDNFDNWAVSAPCLGTLLHGDGVAVIGGSMIAACHWDNNKLNGELILARKDSLLGIYTMEENTVKSELCLDNCVVDVLDLDAQGQRWEGFILDSKPCGYGEYYDSEGRLVYQGIMVGETYMCYGICYFADTGKISYEGMLNNGKRCGSGYQLDRDGTMLSSGYWIGDKVVSFSYCISPRGDFSGLHSLLQHLVINSIRKDIGSKLSFCCFFNQLETLSFGENSCPSVVFCQLEHLPVLRSVHFGIGSFCARKHSSLQLECLSISHCPSLTIVSFERDSCHYAKQFHLERLFLCSLQYRMWPIGVDLV